MQRKALELLRELAAACGGLEAPFEVPIPELERAREFLRVHAFVKRGDPRVAELVTAARRKWKRVKVDIGCGTQARGEDFLTVDAHAGELFPLVQDVPKEGGGTEKAVIEVPIKADIRAEMWELPFEDGSIDEIWCSHALEHVASGNVQPALKEFLRILRPGGRAIITVPDLDYVAKYWLCGTERVWAEQMIFGHQATEGELHRCGFNADVLRGDLVGAGFELRVLKMVWTHSQNCLQAIVLKPEPKA